NVPPTRTACGSALSGSPSDSFSCSRIRSTSITPSEARYGSIRNHIDRVDRRVGRAGLSASTAGGKKKNLGVRQLLADRNAVLVVSQPLVEGLQRGIERAGDGGIARAAEDVVKIALELEHVAEILGPGEAESAVRLGRHRVVAHLLPQRPAELRGHFRAGQMFAGDADGLTDVLPAFFEDAEGTFPDVFGGDAR